MAVETKSRRVQMLIVPLVDVCDTEWRCAMTMHGKPGSLVPLVDVCDTEWRPLARNANARCTSCHSLMSVILNGGKGSGISEPLCVCATR